MTSASFPRSARLLSRAQFLAVQAEGKRFAGRYVVLYERQRDEGGGVRVGLTVSKKVSHLSVERNLLRRQLRHLGRLIRGKALFSADVVLIAKPAARGITFDKLQAEVLGLFKKASLVPADFSLESV